MTLDTDFSGLTLGFGASVVTGDLQGSITTTYYLQMNGTLSGAGRIFFNGGSVGTPLPLTVTGTYFQRSGTCTVSGQKDFVAAQPTHKFVKLTQAANAGDTVLNIDTDLTGAGDTGAQQWVNGSFVNIDNVNKALQTEQKTISSVNSSTQITLTAGLTNAKNVGSYIILLTRNVKVLGLSTGISLFSGANVSDHFACEVRVFSTAFNGMSNLATFDGVYSNGITAISGSGAGPTLSSGGVITGCTTGYNGLSRSTIAAGALISGCSSGMATTGSANSGNSYKVDGTISGCSNGVLFNTSLSVTGTINGCGNAMFGCSGFLSSTANITNNVSGLNQCDGFTMRSPTFSGNSADIATNNGSFLAFNTSLTFSNNGVGLAWQYQESINHGNVAGAYKACDVQGTVLDVASPVYDASRARSYQLTCNSNSVWGFMQQEVYVPAGATLVVRCYVQKSNSVGAGSLPRLWINDAANEPLQSGSPDVEKIMTDSVNTWEVLTGSITNSTNYGKYYMVRMLAKSASIFNAYFDPIIRVTGMMQPANMEGNLAA